jgi:hypothetical protein
MIYFVNKVVKVELIKPEFIERARKETTDPRKSLKIL